MKLRRAIRVLSVATLVLPAGGAWALSAGNFDGWTVSGGVISTSDADPATTLLCDGGTFTCTALNTGDGFLQQEVSDGTNTYIQTIITDLGATSAAGTTGSGGVGYSDESFVRADGTNPGILSQQSVSDPAFNFSSTTQLTTGWAAASGTSQLAISQGFTDTGTAVAGDTFINQFDLAIDYDAAGLQTGKDMSLDQTVEMGNGVDTNTTDVQRFVARQLTGTKLSADGSVDLGPDAQGVDPAPVSWTGYSDGTTTTAAAGDDVMLVWLGQTVDISQAQDGSDMSTFGFQSVRNATTAAEASTYSDVETNAANAPFDWPALFGATAPSLPAVTP